MQETIQNGHMHKYSGKNAKRRGRSIKRQCVTCLQWDKWRTYRGPRPDLTPPKPHKNACTGFSMPTTAVTNTKSLDEASYGRIAVLTRMTRQRVRKLALDYGLPVQDGMRKLVIIQMILDHENKPMTAAEMVQHDMHVNILEDSAVDPNTGHPLGAQFTYDDGDLVPLNDTAAELLDTVAAEEEMTGSAEWLANQQASLSTLKVADLHRIAVNAGLHVTTKTRKADLIDAIVEFRKAL